MCHVALYSPTVVFKGGFEASDDYDFTRFVFADIPNIHCVRDAHQSLRDGQALLPRQGATVADLTEQDSEWLVMLATILRGSMEVATAVHKDQAAVLVHCSDGWDRTAQVNPNRHSSQTLHDDLNALQVCSLSMMMLDSFYRTATGFCTLVQNEWVEMGHQFLTRQGHGNLEVR